MENVGERRCLISTEGSETNKLMHFQVLSKVKKPLLSVSSVADMGFECILGKTGGFLLDTETGNRLPIQRRGNLYHLKVWGQG